MGQFYLSDEDRQLVQELISLHRRDTGPRLLHRIPEDDFPSSDCYAAYPQETSGIPARSGNEPGSAVCNIYRIVDSGGAPTLVAIEGFEKTVLNLSSEALSQAYLLINKDKRGQWIAGTGGGGTSLVECCLAESHPGRGVVFDVWVGVWSSGDNGWTYGPGTGTGTAGGSLVKAIDWRYGTPYPLAGSKGLFIPRTSTEFGTIYECVSLDCEAPPEGCSDTASTGT